jgi:oligopeptide/dipeptide ABC transporter ATP-binding protein
MSASIPLLEIRQLSVRYPLARSGAAGRGYLEAVRDVSLEVRPGEILALVGESGCGKTSIARAVTGLVTSTSVSIRFSGLEQSSLDHQGRALWRRQMQLIFQQARSALSPRRNIKQTLQEPLELIGVNSATERQDRILAALADVNLPTSVLSQYPHQLSGGQLQRIALARALVSQPCLIIADEPMSSLDVSEQARLIGLIRKLRDERNIAFLLITHDLAIAQQLADQVAVMYLGQLLECAASEEFFRSAAHPYSQALLQAAQKQWGTSGKTAPALAGDPPSALTPPTGCVFHSRCQERLERCMKDAPGQTVLGGTSKPGLPHRVRCHLHANA